MNACRLPFFHTIACVCEAPSTGRRVTFGEPNTIHFIFVFVKNNTKIGFINNDCI